MTMSVGSTKPTLQIFSINNKGHANILASIQHGLDADKTPVRPFYYHSFFTTENYVVVPMCPMYYKNNGLDLLLNGSVLGGVEWEPDTPTYFHIVDRHHGKGHVATLVGPSYFAFHVINARDYQDKENGSIRFELDCAAYDGKMIYETHAFGDIIRTSDYHSRYLPNKMVPTQKHNGIDYPALHCNCFGDYRRYHLTWNPSSSVSPTTHYETILTNFDFPRIHSAYTSKAHRYVYGCQILAPTPDRGEQYCLVKIDLNTKEWIRFQHQDEYQNGYLCSEPIFVARPRQEEQEQEPQSEDDGVVLSLVNVFDNRGAGYDYCYLLVLDAASFTQLAYVPIGSFIAPTFHGSYDAEYSFKLGSFN
jgi:torulene dioxygenase